MLHPSLRLFTAVDRYCPQYTRQQGQQASKDNIRPTRVRLTGYTQSQSPLCCPQQLQPPCRHGIALPAGMTARSRRAGEPQPVGNPITSSSHFVSCWASWQCRKRLWATTWWGDMGSQNITGQVAFSLLGRIIMGEPCHVIPSDGLPKAGSRQRRRNVQPASFGPHARSVDQAKDVIPSSIAWGECWELESRCGLAVALLLPSTSPEQP